MSAAETFSFTVKAVNKMVAAAMKPNKRPVLLQDRCGVQRCPERGNRVQIRYWHNGRRNGPSRLDQQYRHERDKNRIISDIRGNLLFQR